MRNSPLYFLLLAVFFCWADCSAKDAGIDVHMATTPVGITYWYSESNELPVVSISIAFKKAGYAYDPHDRQGLAYLVSSVMPRGLAEDGKSFARKFEEKGIAFSVSVDSENLYISLKTLSENLDVALSTLSSCLLHTDVEDDVLIDEKERQKTAIRRDATEPQWLAADGMHRILFKDHPYSYREHGRMETVDAITAGDVAKYMRESFDLDQVAIGIVGDVRESTLSSIMDDYFAALPRGVNLKSIGDADLNLGRRGYVEYSAPQSIIVFAGHGITLSDPRYYAARILNHALGGISLSSVLMKELRWKLGITYSVSSALNNSKHANLLWGVLYTDGSTASRGVDSLLSTINYVKEHGLDEKTFDIAKSGIINSFIFSFLDTSSFSSLLRELQLQGRDIDYVNSRGAKFESVTLQDVNRVAQEFFGDFSIVEVGAKNNIGGEVIQ